MSYIPLPTDPNGNVLTNVTNEDIFSQLVTGSRYNYVATSFTSGVLNIADVATVSTTGTGTSVLNPGQALFESGTGTTSSVTAQSLTSVIYNPGFEIYSMFTAAFTTPTSSASTQFIGFWDLTNNGFYIGYNGLTFSTVVMNGGTATYTAKSSWNGDPLNGSATSKFTSGGTPVAINFTYLNVYRIRFGWLGAAPIVFEVLSPDGVWVVFNTILQPNTSSTPSIQNPNLPISLSITKTSSDSTNLTIATSCWAAGRTTATNAEVDLVNFVAADWTSSTTLNAAVTTSCISAGNASFAVVTSGTISGGAITFEATPDGVNWFSLNVVNVSGVPTAISSYTLTGGSNIWEIFVGGYLEVRIRLSTVISGSGTAKVMVRPTPTATNFAQQVFQSSGSNLHVNVDSLPSLPTGSNTIGTVATVNTVSGPEAPTFATVGTSSAQILAANALRKGVIFTNTSVNNISLAFGANSAVLYSGITLIPYATFAMDSFSFTTEAVNAIASSSSSNLAIQEIE